MNEGLTQARLGNLLTLEYGKSLPERARSGVGFPVYGSNGVVGYHDEPLVNGPGIVVGRKGTAGSVTWSDEDFFPIDTAYWVRVRNPAELNLRYAALMLEALDLPSLTAQTGVPGLNRERAYDLAVSLPPLSVQRRLVDLMEHLDNQVNRLRDEASALDEVLRATRRDLFVRADDWTMTTLGDLTDSWDSKRQPVKSSEREAGPYPYYGASGIVDHVADWIFDGTTLLVSEDGANLRARTAPIAFLAEGRYWVNNHAHVLWNEDAGLLTVLAHQLNAMDLDPYLTGTTMPKLNARALKGIRVRVPPKSQLPGVAAVLNELVQCQDALTEESRHLSRVRMTTLHSLLSGDVGVPESYDDLVLGVAS